MNDQESPFRAKLFEETFESDLNRLETILENESFEESIRNMITGVDKELRELLETKQKPVFVIGGKSRRIVKVILSRLASQLPEGDKLKEVIEQRIELVDQENKGLYGELTTPQMADNLNRPIRLPEKLLDVESSDLIFVDDHIIQGMKAKKVLTLKEQLGAESISFVALVGPQKENQIVQVDLPNTFVVSREQDIFNFMNRFSKRLSNAVDIKQNKYFFHNGHPTKIEESDRSENLQSLIKRLSSITLRFTNTVNSYSR